MGGRTLLNYTLDEGETFLEAQGWVNYLNVVDHLEAGAANSDICTTAGWQHNRKTPLKTVTVLFHSNHKVNLIMHPHMEAFCKGCMLVPGVEFVLELFCNTPEFFLFGTYTSGTGVEHQLTLGQENLKVTLHLSLVAEPVRVQCPAAQEESERQVGQLFGGAMPDLDVFVRRTYYHQVVGRVPDRMIVG